MSNAAIRRRHRVVLELTFDTPVSEELALNIIRAAVDYCQIVRVPLKYSNATHRIGSLLVRNFTKVLAYHTSIIRKTYNASHRR